MFYYIITSVEEVFLKRVGFKTYPFFFGINPVKKIGLPDWFTKYI